MAGAVSGAMDPVMGFALVGALGVGAQWIAWRLRLPAIVLMLAAGLIVGPLLGLFDPARDIGPIVQPLISLAVAVILFEGGLTLDLRRLGDAAQGVKRLVLIGAPLGWLLSTLALHYGAGLSWASATVFGGIMIVTGPTVIAPLLRQAKLSRRPASLLQWEAIVNDPIGALAAVLAFEVVVVVGAGASGPQAAVMSLVGIIVAVIVGFAAGKGIAVSFRRGLVPEYMKVPVLFAVLLVCFAAPNALLHESGLLAVTIMGLVIANADLPSFTELRRFKEHATILLVSGVFILLAASLKFDTVSLLNWRAALFVALVILAVRPLTVFLSLAGSDVPARERALIAFTGPRGVVLVAVAGLFGQRLTAAGVADANLIAPLAFVLVLVTVVLHGFTLGPVARALGLAGKGKPGVMLVGGSRFTTSLGEGLKKADVPVLVIDPNRARLSRARSAGLPVFYGDVLSEAAEDNLEFMIYETVIAATENDAYNTLVTSDLGPEHGRENVWQIARENAEKSRHALPNQIGGRPFGGGYTFRQLEDLMIEGWTVKFTRLTEEFTFEQWKDTRPEAVLIGRLDLEGKLRQLLPEEYDALFPRRAEAALEAELEDLPNERREARRAELQRRFGEAQRRTALAKVGRDVRLVALQPPVKEPAGAEVVAQEAEKQRDREDPGKEAKRAVGVTAHRADTSDTGLGKGAGA
ncbi:K(+)/H(+) antiporter NhaP [Aquimixticola soesokkakensis]|uniref:K(+)/H(+) antiporter NhaP n=1 Tax=Aquimixticola soesokkakensis TaxID=1519096 RepID=A0A1Y5SUL2_9RHOB|nr:sodium:proton antiporter [Aquimixticola soesokkakensis]SLN45418.1 K(+)/H(+) antiporter NhaP [Aquimixticola soesokkakensis]